MNDDAKTFEVHRPALIALAYRMLGDLGRAEDIVQEAWLNWERRTVEVESPRAFLGKIVTRLCLNELSSARARREESRGDRLPEPVDLGESGLASLEALDAISMAFLVVLQRLTPAERAVLLLHDVFDLNHTEIASLIQRSEEACRQLLSRARDHVGEERRALTASDEEHRDLLQAWVRATRAGEVQTMIHLLAEDATLIVDTGPEGRRIGKIRNAGRPVVGATRIAAFIAAVVRENTRQSTIHERSLNGRPAIVYVRPDGTIAVALTIAVANGRIRRLFVHADATRLRHVGVVN
jgi:RNA polymerase sigma-70 factor (ECF subfamily)